MHDPNQRQSDIPGGGASALSPHSFSQELRQLSVQFGDHPVRLGDIFNATQGRGFDLFLVLISLPFITPIPLLGLSTPFGLLVFLMGARLAMGFRPGLPQFLLNRQMPPRFLKKLLGAASRIVRWLEFLLRPRWTFLHEQVVFRRLAGAFIMLSGLLLLLPVPLPFTNSFPAVTVLLLAAGAMERDGLFFLSGCFMFALTVAFFTFLAMGGVHLVENLWRSTFG